MCRPAGFLVLTDAPRSSGGLSETKPPVTSENVQISSSSERRLEAAARDGGEELPSRRATDEGHKNTSHSKENSGKDTAGSLKARTRGLSQEHPINIQNGIHAAERLSCSSDVTHSINFILLGEIRHPGSFMLCSSLSPRPPRERDIYDVVGQTKCYSDEWL